MVVVFADVTVLVTEFGFASSFLSLCIFNLLVY